MARTLSEIRVCVAPKHRYNAKQDPNARRQEDMHSE